MFIYLFYIFNFLIKLAIIIKFLGVYVLWKSLCLVNFHAHDKKKPHQSQMISTLGVGNPNMFSKSLDEGGGSILSKFNPL
jgi:hypothetical protein